MVRKLFRIPKGVPSKLLISWYMYNKSELKKKCIY